MATVATLAVRISAQIAEFQKSFDDASKTVAGFQTSFERVAGNIQNTVDGITQTFSKLGPALGTAAVAIVGVTAAAAGIAIAFKAATAAIETIVGVVSQALTSTADLGDELFTLSQKTNLSVEALSGFKFIAQQTGTSLESITGAVFKMSANLGKGSKETTAAIKGIGLSLQSLKNETPDAAFTAIIEKLAAIPNAADRAAAGVAIFGKSFKDIAQLVNESKDGGLGALTKQAQELGIVMSTETAVAADRFHDSLGVLHSATQGLTQQIGAKLLPAAIAFVEVFGGIFLDAIKKVTQSMGGAGKGFDSFVVFVGEAAARFLEVLAKMVEGTAQWAIEITKRIADQTRAFLDLTPAIIYAGRAVDLLMNQGSHASAFDALTANLDSLRRNLPGVQAGATAAAQGIRDLASGVATAAKGAGATFGETFARIQTEISASAEKMRKSLAAVGTGGKEGADKAEDAFKSFAKSLATLTAQIERARVTGTPLAEIVRLFGEEASKVVPKAHAFGISVTNSVEDIARAFDKLADAKEIAHVFDAVAKLDQRLKAFSTKEMQDELKDLQKWLDTINVENAVAQFERLQRAGAEQGAAFAKAFGTPLNLPPIFDSGAFDFAPIESDFHAAFTQIGQSLPQIIANAMQGGGSVIGSVAAGLGAQFGKSFQDALAAEGGQLGMVSKSAKAMGIASGAIGAAFTGFDLGQKLGKGKGALAGAAAGAAAGSVVPGIGTAIGAGVGALAGFFGGRSAEKKAQQALQDNKKALAEQYGGMAKLNELATKLGVNIQAAFDAKKPEQFASAVEKLNGAIKEQQDRVAGLQVAMEGVNKRATSFAKQFGTQLTDLKKLLDENNMLSSTIRLSAPGGKIVETGGERRFQTGTLTAEEQARVQQLDAEWLKLAGRAKEVREQAQPQFERLGLMVSGVFGGLVKETGDAFAAIQQLAPAFQTLHDGVNEFGLTSSVVIDELLKDFDLVNSEAFGPLLENVQNTGAVLKGLGNAISPEVFQAVATDIGQSLQEIANRGGDIHRALALSAPTLQVLWEHQQKFHDITDQTTLSILDQAEAQGVVGAAMKDANQKILDVLLAIGKVLKADLPKYLTDLPKAADAAASGIEDAFSGVKIDIPYSFTQEGEDPRIRTEGVPALAGGGIVRRPTLALIGERGPEAVVPLAGRSGLGVDEQTIIVNNILDGDVMTRTVLKRAPGALRLYGV